jgi:glutamate dehydrogenase
MTNQATAGTSALFTDLRAALTHNPLPGETEGFDGEKADGATSFLIATAATRAPASALVAIDSSAGESRSRTPKGETHHMRIAIINDDMPFLVDSISNCLAAQGLGIHRLLHPVLAVERDTEGTLIAILPADSPGARKESMIFIEADRINASARHQLEKELHKTLDHIRAAVNDWPAMQQALSEDAERVNDDEGAALLRWLLARNMTQTGHVLLDREGKASKALGICALKDETLLSAVSVKAAFDWFEAGGRTPLVIKSSQLSRIHRHSQIDLFIVPVRDGKDITALSMHAGLWTSAALATAPDKVPVLRAALNSLMEKYDFDPSGHAGKALFHALTALPHDVVISFDRAALERLVLTFMSLSDRPRPRLVLASAALDRHLYAFVWLPRDELSTARRSAIQEMLVAAAKAPLLSWSISLEEGSMAQLRLTLDLRGGGTMPDEDLLDRQVKHMVRGWLPAVEAALADFEEAGRAATLTERYANGFPINYRNGAGAEEAALDINELYQLRGEEDKRARLYRNVGDDADHLRIKLYSMTAIALSDAIPALENFGFKAIEEVTTAVDQGQSGHIHRILLARRDGGDASELINRSDLLCDAIADVLTGTAEDDRFNELIVSAHLDPASVNLLRALYRYLRQTGAPYAMATFADALRKNAAITDSLIALFTALHDPKVKNREEAALLADQAIISALTQVAAIDEDRILRLLRAVIKATLRTNFFAPAAAEALAFKLDSVQVPGLPAPLPWREIWVYSRRVEGIHLRAGPVARGGLRWSDRRDDFRTEILGLMKAQRVKNAVIVPTGAKGGFYPKQLPSPAINRDAWLAEGTESYRIFIRTLLSLTDNIIGGQVQHPAHIVIHDGADPYFVVAADKGTATFSDVANALALERTFWLGDAFASGGSNGYDHKAMGITARGAWISVQRHFAEMGLDVQSESVRVIGCGDMSGDVFGNGMLLSKAIKLVAAFDHRHIFLDPDPDPAKSWAERDRMFKLPRSSWDDYDKSLISQGGGVFSRASKTIPLSPQVQQIIGTNESEIEPTALISALLRAPADLLWFGGIGTYVKAASQSHSEVGDPANDGLRVNAEELRVKVIGEGANLGVTQAGRIAYALHGGRINTDFIDNSAGVDCSDNEVNIKIALNAEMAHERLSFDDRNAMLVQMTDAVADLVLEDNRLQALGLSIAQAGGADSVASYVRLIETFEAAGKLDRAVEGLANNDQLLRRAQDGQGLARPELAVLLSTAKLLLQDEIEQSEISTDASMDGELAQAFPPLMQQSQSEAIRTHQLRREIIATKLANRIINRLGLIHPFELQEEEGCSLADLASAFVIAERLNDAGSLWDGISAASMPEDARLALLNTIASAMRSQMADIVRALPVGTLPGDGEASLREGIARLPADMENMLSADARQRADQLNNRLITLGAPANLADGAIALVWREGRTGLSHLATRLGKDGAAVTHAYMRIGEAVGIDWLQSAASRMEPSDPWERLLIAGILRDMQQIRFDLLSRLQGDPLEATEGWIAAQQSRIDQFAQMVRRARSAPFTHVAMLAELAAKARALLAH